MLRSGSDSEVVRFVSLSGACDLQPWPDCGWPFDNSSHPNLHLLGLRT